VALHFTAPVARSLPPNYRTVLDVVEEAGRGTTSGVPVAVRSPILNTPFRRKPSAGSPNAMESQSKARR
jgi:hypothetical protein